MFNSDYYFENMFVIPFELTKLIFKSYSPKFNFILTLKIEKGGLYEGYWVNGRRTGMGRLIDQNGDVSVILKRKYVSNYCNNLNYL